MKCSLFAVIACTIFIAACETEGIHESSVLLWPDTRVIIVNKCNRSQKAVMTTDANDNFYFECAGTE